MLIRLLSLFIQDIRLGLQFLYLFVEVADPLVLLISCKFRLRLLEILLLLLESSHFLIVLLLIFRPIPGEAVLRLLHSLLKLLLLGAQVLLTFLEKRLLTSLLLLLRWIGHRLCFTTERGKLRMNYCL